tara:strand:- start:85 stop:1158 length:1074 start_codon:yes stop_codon:yes gene_type:complete
MECLNCGHPFFGNEKYCPNCGQKNKNKKIKFKSFLGEVFNGFTSWDAKFWKTLIPLLTKPGKVSKDYISGKRSRYSNPFQFYLSVSILFFIILGLTKKYNEFQDFSKKEIDNNFNAIELEKNTTIRKDSILKNIYFNDIVKNLDTIETSKNSAHENKSTNLDKLTSSLKSQIQNEPGLFGKMMSYHENHKNRSIDDSLDSLKIDKNFQNRFNYLMAKKTNSLFSDILGEGEKFFNELISYASISIFIFLPIFTLFLQLIYLRRKFTYVEHLIFVFHTQTVFFILLIIFYTLNLVTNKDNISWIFVVLFLFYLLSALKRFYDQGYFKTFIKFCLLNFIFTILGVIGFMILSILTYTLY